MATIFIPSAFRHYCAGRDRVEVPAGGSLRSAFEQLDQECPGIKNELIVDEAIRLGIAVFINDEQTTQGLLDRVPEDGTVHLLPALGGGC